MGHSGMRASLVSREVIADSVETVVHAECLDGLVTLAGCDKSLPAMLMAAVRLDVPSVFVYGGTILPGVLDGRRVDIKDVFEGVGAHASGLLDDAGLQRLERAACPSAGSCAGMYTANTMACVAEAMGMSLPGSAAVPAPDPRRAVIAQESGDAVVAMLQAGRSTRDVLTRAALLNGVAVTMAIGGSTNAVLHLMAIAKEARAAVVAGRHRRGRPQGAAHRRLAPARQLLHERPGPGRRAHHRAVGADRGRPGRRRRPHRQRAHPRRQRPGAGR